MKRVKLIIASLASVLLITSCAGDKKSKTEVNSESEVKTEVSKKDLNETYKITVTGNDMMKFNRSTITVDAGQKVELTLKHIGKMSVEVMGHNLVVLKKGTDVAVFATSAIAAKDNGYIPEGTTDVLVHTKMIGGGESDTITFTAPTEKGEYDFICSFPGHFGMMKGKFIVE